MRHDFMAFGETPKRKQCKRGKIKMAYNDLEFGMGTNAAAQEVVLHADGSSLTLPDGSYLKDADFARDGMDLLLTTDQGQVTVEGYFALETSPVLNGPSGLSLSPKMVNSFVKASPDYASNLMMSDESPVGSVDEVSGSATVTRVDGTVETVRLGTEIYQGDIVETGGQGAVNIGFIDDTSFAVSEDARLSIDEYVFDPVTESGQTDFSVLKGVFVYTSGAIGRDDPDDVTIDTPVGSIGIRGTIIAGDVNSGEITVVEGAIVLRDFNGNEVTLANQFETARFDSSGRGIEQLGEMAAADVASKFSSVSGVAPTLFSSIEDAVSEQDNNAPEDADDKGAEAGADEGTEAQQNDDGQEAGAEDSNSDSGSEESGSDDAGEEKSDAQDEAKDEAKGEEAASEDSSDKAQQQDAKENSADDNSQSQGKDSTDSLDVASNQSNGNRGGSSVNNAHANNAKGNEKATFKVNQEADVALTTTQQDLAAEALNDLNQQEEPISLTVAQSVVLPAEAYMFNENAGAEFGGGDKVVYFYLDQYFEGGDSETTTYELSNETIKLLDKLQSKKYGKILDDFDNSTGDPLETVWEFDETTGVLSLHVDETFYQDEVDFAINVRAIDATGASDYYELTLTALAVDYYSSGNDYAATNTNYYDEQQDVFQVDLTTLSDESGDEYHYKLLQGDGANYDNYSYWTWGWQGYYKFNVSEQIENDIMFLTSNDDGLDRVVDVTTTNMTINVGEGGIVLFLQDGATDNLIIGSDNSSDVDVFSITGGTENTIYGLGGNDVLSVDVDHVADNIFDAGSDTRINYAQALETAVSGDTVVDKSNLEGDFIYLMNDSDAHKTLDLGALDGVVSNLESIYVQDDCITITLDIDDVVAITDEDNIFMIVKDADSDATVDIDLDQFHQIDIDGNGILDENDVFIADSDGDGNADTAVAVFEGTPSDGSQTVQLLIDVDMLASGAA